MRKYVMLAIGLLRLMREKIWNLSKLKTRGFYYFVGKNVKIWLQNGGKCDLGTKTWLSDLCYLEANGGSIKLGHNNFFNGNVRIIALEEICIGDNNLFAPNVVIVDHGHEYRNMDELICKQGFSKSAVQIGSDNWICANVVITEGATIGNHVIVAANSVVRGTLDKAGVYAGNPAVLVKEL